MYVGGASAIKCYVCDSNSPQCLESIFVKIGIDVHDNCACCTVSIPSSFVACSISLSGNFLAV